MVWKKRMAKAFPYGFVAEFGGESLCAAEYVVGLDGDSVVLSWVSAPHYDFAVTFSDVSEAGSGWEVETTNRGLIRLSPMTEEEQMREGEALL